jgi:hypothetical protein
MGKRGRSEEYKTPAEGVTTAASGHHLHSASAAALQELAILQSQAAMLSAQLQEVSARALATMQACSQLAVSVAGQAQATAHTASADAAHVPRQNPSMPTIIGGFPAMQFPFLPQAQAAVTWPVPTAIPPVSTSEIEEALHSTSRRREKDKEKKRKRRDMSGSLLKQVHPANFRLKGEVLGSQPRALQVVGCGFWGLGGTHVFDIWPLCHQLQNMLPGENLSLNATLQRTIDAVKSQLNKVPRACPHFQFPAREG